MSNPITRTLGSQLPIALLLSATALAACGDDETAPSGSGSGGATSSSAATTGASTGSTSASTTGSAGAGGEGAEGGAGGQGGGPPEIDPYFARCLWIDACEADGGAPFGVEACLAAAYETQWGWASTGPGEMALAAMECRLQAQDCATERACSPDPSTYDDLCQGRAGTDFCDGDVWVICDVEGAGFAALDCAARGESCGTDYFSGCGTEPCHIGETPSSCDADDPTALLFCTGAGFVKRVDCATQSNFVYVNTPDGELQFTIAGEVCGPDANMGGDMGCIGTGGDCEFFGEACDGDVMETCAGGKLGHRDCSALTPEGQSCGYMQGGPFAGGTACGAVEPECVLTESDESCDDGLLTFCGYAGTETFDCAAAGYSGCDTAERGGRTIAFCVD